MNKHGIVGEVLDWWSFETFAARGRVRGVCLVADTEGWFLWYEYRPSRSEQWEYGVTVPSLDEARFLTASGLLGFVRLHGYQGHLSVLPIGGDWIEVPACSVECPATGVLFA
jgi:hypothetical protein